jgi:hypothetical protein
MQQGLLWFDNNTDIDITEKVKQAATRYRKRLQHQPTVCYVNEAEYDQNFSKVGKIIIRPASNVRRHHFWLGIDADKSQ